MRRLLIATLSLVVPFALSCASSTELARRSEAQLGGGDVWKAWTLAVKAVDKEPGNARARAAAAAAYERVASDWRRRIRAVAAADTTRASDLVMEFAEFRVAAARVVDSTPDGDWLAEERAIRTGAARIAYGLGSAALAAKRPREAYGHLQLATHHLPGYRDAAVLAERALERGRVRVAVVPFRAGAGPLSLGREVSDYWRDRLFDALSSPNATFTRVLPGSAVEDVMTVAELGRMTRDEAVRIARKAGAERVVWAEIGGINSDTRTDVFDESVARRITQKGPDGKSVTRWVEVPVRVVSRVRTVTVRLDCEVIATARGSSLSRHSSERSVTARTLWTDERFEGDLSTLALFADTVATADPRRAKAIAARWSEVAGEDRTLKQVFEERRRTQDDGRWQRPMRGRFISGGPGWACSRELAPIEDMAFAALADAWKLVGEDLARFDAMDDVDLMPAATTAR